ncbi:hypothetical protein HYX19_03185, partial [Candidatus Woesearchaeota archaeon]|nr:hypothetical protein [Candidatus Woesearchaeota archaeon]
MKLTEIIIAEIPEDVVKLSITAGKVKVTDFGWRALFIEKEIPGIRYEAETKDGKITSMIYDARNFWERNFRDNGKGYERARIIGEELKAHYKTKVSDNLDV